MNPHRQQQTGIERKIMQARVRLLIREPFFGSLCLRLKLVHGTNRTLATDGRHIFYNPAFVEALEPAELEGCFAHEVLHCALGHHCRRGERDPKKWNEAADYAINPILLRNGFVLPKGVLVNPEYDNLSAEDIYARLIRESQPSPMQSPETQQGSAHGGGSPQGSSGQGTSGQPQSSAQQTGQDAPENPMPDGNGSGETTPEDPPCGFGEVLDAVDEQGELASEGDLRRQQQEWNIAAEQAIRVAKACGKEPGSVERLLQQSRESEQDWRSILREFVAATTAADYRWTPPNRRYVASGKYLPSVERRGIGEIVIAVDTSGSVGEKELAQFAGEITAIVDEAKPERVHVVYCDGAVQSAQDFGPCEPIDLEPKGGGGTDFRPVFDWVEEHSINPVCLIYLTDLCCYSYPENPDYPVLWVTDSRRKAPFGETIHISLG